MIARILKIMMNNETNDEYNDVEEKEEGRVQRFGSKLRRPLGGPRSCRLCFIPLLILPTHIIIITGDHSLIGQGGVELLNLIGDQRPNVSLSTPPSLMVVF